EADRSQQLRRDPHLLRALHVTSLLRSRLRARGVRGRFFRVCMRVSRPARALSRPRAPLSRSMFWGWTRGAASPKPLGMLAHARAAFGILLFQDLAAIPVLAIVPLLGETTARTRPAWMTFAIGAVVIALLVVLGRLLLRPLFRFVARAKSHELSVASALLVVI